jgi:hypothetical protein
MATEFGVGLPTSPQVPSPNTSQQPSGQSLTLTVCVSPSRSTATSGGGTPGAAIRYRPLHLQTARRWLTRWAPASIAAVGSQGARLPR